MLVIFRPLSGAALATGLIQSWTSLHGLRSTSMIYWLYARFTKPATNIGSSSFMQRRNHVNTIQYRSRLLWAKTLKNGRSQSGKLFCGQKNQRLKLFLGTTIVKLLKRRGTNSQCKIQKLASLMVWMCIRAYGTGSFHIWKGNIDGQNICRF